MVHFELLKCHNSISDILGNFGCILPLFYGKNSKSNFKNIKKYENNWKHNYENIHV